jgi:hypothetical protein
MTDREWLGLVLAAVIVGLFAFAVGMEWLERCGDRRAGNRAVRLARSQHDALQERLDHRYAPYRANSKADQR